MYKMEDMPGPWAKSREKVVNEMQGCLVEYVEFTDIAKKNMSSDSKAGPGFSKCSQRHS